MEKLQPPQAETARGWRKPARWAALGALALTGLWAGYQQFYDKSGEITSYDPKIKTTPTIDSEHVVVSWNMHNETSERYEEIEILADENSADVVALQEVSFKDARGLHGHFPEWYVKVVMADAKTQPLDGGYVNVLMTRQKQENVSSAVIEGNSVPDALVRTAGGITTDVINLDTNFQETKDATQEDRAAIGSGIQIASPDGMRTIHTATVHIAGNKTVHEDQFNAVENYAASISDDNEATIICGDFNSTKEEMVLNFAELGFVVPETDATSVNGYSNLDFCAYRSNGVLGLGVVEVAKNFHTDHYPLIGRWSAR